MNILRLPIGDILRLSFSDKEKAIKTSIEAGRDDVFEALLDSIDDVPDEVVKTAIHSGGLSHLIKIQEKRSSFTSPEFISASVSSGNAYSYQFIIEKYTQPDQTQINNLLQSVYQIIDEDQSEMMCIFMKYHEQYYENSIYYYALDANRLNICEYLEDFLFNNHSFKINILRQCMEYRKRFDVNFSEHKYRHLISPLIQNSQTTNEDIEDNEIIDTELEDEMVRLLSQREVEEEEEDKLFDLDAVLDSLLNNLNTSTIDEYDGDFDDEDGEDEDDEELTFEDIQAKIRMDAFLEEQLNNANIENTFSNINQENILNQEYEFVFEDFLRMN